MDLIWLGVSDWNSASGPSPRDRSALIFQKEASSSFRAGPRASRLEDLPPWEDRRACEPWDAFDSCLASLAVPLAGSWMDKEQTLNSI